MGNAPTDFIPVAAAGLQDSSAKLKALRKETKEASKEIEKLQKAGKEIPTELKKRYQEAAKAQDQFYTKMQNSKARVRDFIRNRDRDDFRENIDRYYGSVQRYRGIARDVKKVIRGFEQDGLAGGIGEAAWEGGQKAWEFGGATVSRLGLIGMAVGAGFKAYTTIRDARAINAESVKAETKALRTSGLGHGISVDNLRKQSRKDVLQEDNSFMGVLRSIKPTNFSSDSIFEKALDKFGPLSPEIESKINAKFNELLAKVQTSKDAGYKALDLGDAQEARKNFKAANDAISGSMPMWRDPMALYTARESSREAAKTWARNNMRRAASRTGD